MYLVKTKNGDKILNSTNDIKNINKNDIIEIYFLTKVEYDSLVSTSDIRDCIYNFLKGHQIDKDEVLEYVSEKLDVKKNEVSKVITAMKKEKIIYIVKDFNWLGID